MPGDLPYFLALMATVLVALAVAVQAHEARSGVPHAWRRLLALPFYFGLSLVWMFLLNATLDMRAILTGTESIPWLVLGFVLIGAPMPVAYLLIRRLLPDSALDMLSMPLIPTLAYTLALIPFLNGWIAD